MGFLLGRLACDLVDKRGLDRFQARVYMCFGVYVLSWSAHMPESRALIERATDAANTAGDLTFALYARKHLATNMLVSGEKLRDVQQQAEQGLAFARKARFGLVVDAFIVQLILVRLLRGLPPDAVSAEDAASGGGRFEQHLARSPHLALPACWYWVYRLQACVVVQDLAGGLAAEAKAERLLWSSRAHIETAEYHLYAALVRAAACDASPPDEQRPHRKALREHQRLITLWAENCRENFATRRALIDAEIARLEGRELEAERLYEEAVRSAREFGLDRK